MEVPWGILVMEPSWVIWKDVWLESFDGPWLGNLEGWLNGIFLTGTWLGYPEGILVGNFGTAPGWENLTIFGWKA